MIINTKADGAAVARYDVYTTKEPTVDFNDSDSFAYNISDSEGESSTATATFTLSPINDVHVVRVILV